MSARFRLDPRGQLVPENQDAEAALPSRAGAYELLRTAPDMIVLLRSPASGGTVDAPRVVLAGDVHGFPLSDLIAFLSQSRWSGVVNLHEAGAHRAITMKDGDVRGASSDSPGERLAEILIRMGFVGAVHVEEVLREDPPSRLGRALVERGILQPHDLWKCLNQQVADIFHAILLARSGAFFLVDQALDEKSQNIQVSTQSLLMDSVRKIDEMAHFRKRIPHGRVFVAKKRPSDGTLEPDEDRLLGLADGAHSVVDLATAAKLSEFDATKVIFRLLEGGFATVAEHRFTPSPMAGGSAPREPHRSPASEGDVARVVRTFNEIFGDITREVSRRGMDRQLLGSANAALAGTGLSASPVVVGLSFDSQGHLAEPKLLEQFARARAQLGSEPLAALRQVLSDVMFFMLFQAGELLESSADEELATRVKTLLAALDET